MSDSSDNPRAFTAEEIRAQFLQHVWYMIDYWLRESRTPDTKGKMEGLAHSFLAALDGCSMGVPGFALTPSVHPEDKEYHIENDENWYPDDVDIGGGLHEEFHETGRKLGFIK